MSFNRNNMEPICPPDCSERTPGCHDRCGRYKERKLARDKRKLDYYGNPDVTRYLREKIGARKDRLAKANKEDASRRTKHSNH